MKIGQLIEHNKRNIFIQKLWKNLREENSSGSFFFFFLILYEVKASSLQLRFNIFLYTST